MTGGKRACSIGNVRKLSDLFHRLFLTMDFYVAESPPLGVIAGVTALIALQQCLDFGLQQSDLVPVISNPAYSIEYAAVEVPADDSMEADSADFTTDSDAAPDVTEGYE